MYRRISRLLPTALVALAVTVACTPAAPPAAPTARPAGAAPAQPAAGKVFRVGMTQIVSHPVLDAIRTAAVDELKKQGFEEGKNLTLDVQIAQNDQTLSKTINDKFVTDKVDAIYAISTPSMQAAVQASKASNTPVVFVAVSDPVGAGVLTAVDKPSGTNVTGVYNFDPVDAQMEVAKQIRPDLKTIGAIYNPGESNSVSNIKALKAATEKLGLTVVEAPVSGTADVRSSAQSLVGRVDALYMPTDNTVMTSLEALVKVAQDAKLPLFTGDVDSVRRGGTAAVGDDPDDKGRQAAVMLARILKGEQPGSIMPERVRKREIFLNKTSARLAGIELPEPLIKQASQVFE